MNRKKIRKGIALLLSFVTVFNAISITALADYYNPNTSASDVGNGASAPGNGSGGAHLVWLDTVDNEIRNVTDWKLSSNFQDASGNAVGAPQANIIYQYRNNVDEMIFSPDKAQAAAFLRRTGYATSNNDKVHIQMGGQTIGKYAPGQLSSYTRTGTVTSAANIPSTAWQWYKASVLNPQSAHGTGTVLDFNVKTREMAELFIQAATTPGTGLYTETAYIADQIELGFADNLSGIAALINEYATVTDPSAAGDKRPLLSGAYQFQLLAAFYLLQIKYSEAEELCYASKEALINYFLTQNGDAADKHTVVAVVALSGQRGGTTQVNTGIPTMYALPDALSHAGIANLSSITQLNAFVFREFLEPYKSVYGSDRVRLETAMNEMMHSETMFQGFVQRNWWMYHYFANHRVNQSGFLEYSGASTSFWTNNFSWDMAIMQTDAAGNPWGPRGFTLFAGSAALPGTVTASHNPQPPASEPAWYPYSFSLSASPKSKDVSGSGAEFVENEVATIDIQLSATESDMLNTWNWFEQQSGNNKSFKLTLFLEEEDMKGSDTANTEHFDLITLGAGHWTLTMVDGKKAIQSAEIKTYADLKDYLTGSKSHITILDTGVTVRENLKNRYKAYGTLCFYSGASHHQDLPAKPTGVGVDGVKAYDDASWILTVTPHYYSDMRQLPLAEIKHNKPYAEDAKDPTGNGGWEAMAGIPTTADLFVGAGATEYMVNIELEWKTENASRTYKITVNNESCWGADTKCTLSCPGHQDSQGNSLPCPGYSGSCTHYSGSGCVHTSYRNQAHPGSCSYVYELTVNIDEYSYMDIIGLELWLLDTFKYTGNAKLTNPSSFSLTPAVGYDAFYSQAGYSSGNGRLQFSTTLDAAGQVWGNTSKTNSYTVNGNHDACKTIAVNAINNIVKTLTAESVTVISDYLIVDTTEGYQNVMYYSYPSTGINLSGYTVSESDFGAASTVAGSKDSFNYKVTAAETFYFPKAAAEMDVKTLWQNNANSAAKWDSDHPTTSGYNGNYTSVKRKYAQDNDTTSTHRAAKQLNAGQPNTQNVSGSASKQNSSSSTYNSYYVKTGLNILDATSRPSAGREWSAADGIDPVTNGEWDTGNMTVKYKKSINYKGTGGNDWSAWTSYKEAPYSESHEKINNVLIHNPVSNANATVISNDSQFDLRVYEELAPAVVSSELRTCPRNSNCMYSHLHCTEASYHTASCYREVATGYNCGEPYNTHVCDEECAEDNWQKYCQVTASGFKVYVTGSDKVYTTQFGNYYSYEIYSDNVYTLIQHSSGCTYNGQYHVWNVTTGKCLGCSHSTHTNDIYIGKLDLDRTIAANTSNTAMTIYEYVDIPSELSSSNGWAQGKNGQNYRLDTPYEPTSSTIRIYRDDYEAGKYTITHFGPDSSTADGECKNTDPHHIWWEGNYCLSCRISDTLTSHYLHSSNHATQSKHNGITCHLPETKLDVSRFVSGCTGKLNAHVHTSSCKMLYGTYLVCSDPHHYSPGESHDVKNANNHYPFADTRCYTPCGDDTNHATVGEVTLPDGQKQSSTGIFINIDRDFSIYYPDTGDFEQDPNLWGLKTLSKNLGPGYTNQMDTDEWIRNKYVIFPTSVMDSSGNVWRSGERIDLLKLPDKNKVYQFTNLLANDEASAATVQFLTVANNAPEVTTYNDAKRDTNDVRGSNYAAEMSVTKVQNIDIVGSIGALRIEDVGDLRFATLFKQSKNNGKWLIPNVVPEVDYALPNKVVADNFDARLEDARKTGYYHGTYGITTLPTGGVAHDYETLPLTPRLNPVKSLQQEAMRPGYKLFMSVETIGNYYGENVYYEGTAAHHYNRTTSNGNGAFSYKMQILPRYYELNLDTGVYQEVDVYMYDNSTYVPIYMGYENMDKCTEYYAYLNWLEEAQRRSFTSKESQAGLAYQSYVSTSEYQFRLPTNEMDVIGTPNMLILIDLDRTLIGSSTRYGVSYTAGNKELGYTENRISELGYINRSQRWHWTLGLPSSSVFVYAGEPCNDRNIKEMQSHNAVIVCALNIKVRGSVWTLQYDGSGMNNNGFQIYPDGKTYGPPPATTHTPDAPNDPVVVVYENNKTSKDDMTTTGTH